MPSVRVEVIDLELGHLRTQPLRAATRAGLGAAVFVVATASVGEAALAITGDGLALTARTVAITAPDPAPGERVLAPGLGLATLVVVGPAALSRASGALVVDAVATTQASENVPPPVLLSRSQSLVRRPDGALVVVAAETLRRVVASV